MGTRIDIPDFPIEVRKLSPEESAEAFKDMENCYMKYMIRIGPKGYFYSDGFLPLAAEIYNLELRPSDIIVSTFPKAGTTWTQELVWVLGNDFDYETAKKVPLVERFPFLEYSMFVNNDRAREVVEETCGHSSETNKTLAMLSVPATDVVANMPSPRYMKTHSPFSLLPPGTIDKVKVIYVARDPRDVAVSFYHHYKIMIPIMGYKGDFKAYWELFKKDMVDWAPYFEHLKEAWELKDHPNMLFLHYEDLSQDISAIIRRVAKFLGKSVTDDQVAGLADHLSFENFKHNKAVNYDVLKQIGIIVKDKDFVRKGKAGGWRDYFDEEMARDAEQWIADNLRGTDIVLPQFNKST